MSLKTVSAPVLNRREFVRVSDVVYWLDVPESVQAAQNALRDLGERYTTIWITPSDEHDPEVYSHDQRLVAAKPIEPEPVVEALPVVPDEIGEESDSSKETSEPDQAESKTENEPVTDNAESTPSVVEDEKNEATG